MTRILEPLAVAHAPGKVILVGEHAVVHGGPAIAGTLGLVVEARAFAGEGRLRLASGEVLSRQEQTPLGEAWSALRRHMELDEFTGEIDIHLGGSLPAAVGLGSSAALAVALARVLGLASRQTLSRDRIEQAALAAERVFHGRPSGIDVAIVVREGLGRFTRAAGLRSIACPRPVPLVVGHTGRQRDTKGRVAHVAERLARHPEETHARFAAMARLVDEAEAALARSDWPALGLAMDENAVHLAGLGVSSPEIDELCRLAHEAGALGAKLTGAGGGGSVLALAPGREEAVCAVWRKAGYAGFITELGASSTAEVPV